MKDLTGDRFGRWLIVALAPERSADGRALWTARHDCGAERTVTSDQLSTCRAKGCEPKCPRCSTRRANSRCGLCRQLGHITLACPSRKHEGRVCYLCASLPHRVTGPRCRVCLSLYADEPREEIDYAARQTSNFARAMGES